MLIMHKIIKKGGETIMFNRHMGHGRRPICCPPNVSTQVAPAQVSPTQHVVRTNINNTVVPHFHPVHVTTVNRNITRNQHFIPVTTSTVNQYASTQNFGGVIRGFGGTGGGFGGAGDTGGGFGGGFGSGFGGLGGF